MLGVGPNNDGNWNFKVLEIIFGPTLLVIVFYIFVLLLTKFLTQFFKISKKTTSKLYWFEIVVGIVCIILVLYHPELISNLK